MNAIPKTRIYLENKPTVTRIVPELAVAIGLNESIILLQLDFWIGQSDNFQDGRYWTFQSLRDMREKAFGYLGLATINRAVLSLEEQGLIIVGNYNKRKGDTTRWFALNPDGLRKLSERVPCIAVTNSPIQNETPPIVTWAGAIQSETPTDQNGSTLPEIPTENQKQKEVVVARPRPLSFDAFFHPVFLEVTNDPKSNVARPQSVEAVQPDTEPTDEGFVLDLFEDYFGKRNLPAKEQVRAAIAQYGLAAVRNALEEAKATNRSGVVFWSYVEVIADRHYQRQLDQQPAGAHDQLLGMRRGYQVESPEDAMIYTHPLWQAFRDHWQAKTSVAPNIPPLSVKRYAETARALDRLKVTPDQIVRLVDRMIAKRRAGYKFEFAAGDITEILTEDALGNQQRDPALIAAICKVWKVAAGEFANGIADILLSMEKPAVADDVLKFGAWYAAQPQFKTQAKPPTTFDALILRVNEFRATQRPAASSSPSTTFTPLPRSAPISAEERERIKREVLAKQQPEGVTP